MTTNNKKKIIIASLVFVSLIILAYIYICYITAGGAIIEN